MIISKILKVCKRLINLAGILVYQLKIQFFFKLFNLNKKYLNDETVILKNQGYLHLKEIIPKNTVDDFFQIYEKELIPKGKPITVSLIKPAIKTNKKSNLLYSLSVK